MPTLRTLPPRNLGTLSGAPPCVFTHANPLDPGLEREIPRQASLIVWAGWYDAAADPGLGSFESDHRLWTQGLSALREALTRLEAILHAQDAVLYLRPACGLVLSDPHSIAALLKEVPGTRLRILVDPIAMLTPGMAAHAEDHLPRMLDKLGPLEACAAIVLAGASATREDRLAHQPLNPDRAIDSVLLRAYRHSAFVEREAFVPTAACRSVIELGALA